MLSEILIFVVIVIADLYPLVGPKTNNVEMLSKLRDAGMNIVRMVSCPSLICRSSGKGRRKEGAYGVETRAWEEIPNVCAGIVVCFSVCMICIFCPSLCSMLSFNYFWA